MPELPGMPSTIRCAACGFENTTTSLYCQDCGVRLVAPPSIVTEEAAAATTANPAVTSRTKPRIISEHRPHRVGSYLAFTLRILILAAFAALILQLLRPPANLPPAATPHTPAIVGNIHTGLQNSAQAGQRVTAPWKDVNSYLAAILMPAPGSSFVRAQVSPAQEGFALLVERKVAGVSLYSTVVYRIVTRSNGLALEPVRASIGRMPLPGGAAGVIDYLSNGLGESLSSDLEVLREAKSVQIAPQQVVIDFEPSRS